jgi:putative transposase
MARLPGVCLPVVPLHVIQRFNNRQACFASGSDFAAYVSWLQEYAEKFCVDIHAWVFMTNHVHLLVSPKTTSGVSKMMQSLGQRYVRYFNYTYRRTGTLWEGRYNSCILEADNYLLACQRYIKPNPVRTGMVDSPVVYKCSSYHANGLGIAGMIHTPHPAYLLLGRDRQVRNKAYRELFKAHIDVDEIALFRDSTNKGLAIGNDRFKREVEQLTGLRVTERKRGPKPRSEGFSSDRNLTPISTPAPIVAIIRGTYEYRR